jgi:hypothetical protein
MKKSKQGSTLLLAAVLILGTEVVIPGVSCAAGDAADGQQPIG